MPSRIIKESIQTSDTLASISADAERLFWRLVTAADDYGRFDARPHIVLGKCLAAFVERFTVDEVAGWLGELDAAGLIKRYEIGGRSYLHLTTWDKHQRPPRARESKFPPPPTSADICGHVTADADICGHVMVDAPVSRDSGSGIRYSRSGIREAGGEDREQTAPPPPPPPDDDPAIRIEQMLPPYLDRGMTAPRDSREVQRWIDAGATPEMIPQALNTGLATFQERSPGRKPMHATWYGGFVAGEISGLQQARQPPIRQKRPANVLQREDADHGDFRQFIEDLDAPGGEQPP